MSSLLKKWIIKWRKLPTDPEGYEAPRVLVKNKIWRSIGRVSFRELLK